MKAGRCVGLANFYPVIVIADNTTFYWLQTACSRIGHSPQTNDIMLDEPSAGVAQAVEHLPCNHEFMGSVTSRQNFSHVCARFGILGRCGFILSRFWLRGPLQYCTALTSYLMYLIFNIHLVYSILHI